MSKTPPERAADLTLNTKNPTLVLGHLRLEERLGEGAAGVVYRTRLLEDRPYGATGTEVAVKVLRPSFLGEAGAFKRFLREAEVGARIDHPGVVRAFEADAANTPAGLHHFIVSEYARGATLQAILRRDGPLPEALVRHVAAQIASALGAVHAAGAVHRDVKPANVIITPDHQVKLMDLGVLRLFGHAQRLTDDGHFLGTLAYAAPEQFSAPQEVGPASDLFGLGATLFELLTGEPPFPASDFVAAVKARTAQPARRARTVVPALSDFLDEVVACLLEIDPAGRTGSSAETAILLEQGEESEWWRTRRLTLSRSQPAPVPAGRIPIERETVLVARADEIAHLVGRYRQACHGRGGVVLLEGEAGVGKSRLVDELIRLLAQEPNPPRVLYGAYLPGEATSAYDGFTAAVAAELGPARLEARLAARLGPAANLAGPFAELLAGMTATALPAESVQTLFCHLARSLAEERPLVWCVDDLHLASTDGRGLLLALARVAATMKLLLVVTAGPGLSAAFLDGLTRLEGVEKTTVKRLTPRGVIELIGAALGSQSLAERLGGRVALRSDGNPRFILEILRELRDGGALKPEPDGSYRAASSITDIGVPSSVRGLVAERLRSFADEERAILDAAAVIGYRFDPDLIARARGSRRLAVLEALAAMERNNAIVRSAGPSFEFAHPHVRDAVLEVMPATLKLEYNTLVAEAYEAQRGLGREPAQVRGEDAAFLASHHLQGSRPDEGMPYVARALDHLVSRYLHEAAIALAVAALAALGEGDPALSADLRLRQSPSLEFLGLPREQRAVLERAVEEATLAGDSRLLARARRKLGRLFYMTGDLGAARPHLEAASALARSVEDHDTAALAASDLGFLHNQQGEPQAAIAWLTRATDLANAHGLRTVELSALGNLGLVELEQGRYAEAAATLERQRSLASSYGDRLAESRACGNLGLAQLYLGRLEQARACYQDQVDICRSIGYRPGEAIATGNLAGLIYNEGDLGRSRAQFAHYRVLSHDVGSRVGEATATINLGVLALDEGNHAEANDQIGAGLALARELGDRRLEADALHGLGELFRARGELDAAITHHHRALKLRREAEAREPIAISLVALARIHLESGATEAALAPLEEARVLAAAEPGNEPGPLPLAYLALLGRGDAGAVEVRPEIPATVRAETHVVLDRAGAPGGHAEAAKALLDRMSAHLRGEAIDRFWRLNPVARALVDGPGDPGR